MELDVNGGVKKPESIFSQLRDSFKRAGKGQGASSLSGVAHSCFRSMLMSDE
jgi:hypothetical protein